MADIQSALFYFCLIEYVKVEYPRAKNKIVPGTREKLCNPIFKPVEFDWFRIQAKLNGLLMTPKQWIGKTKA